MQIESRHFILSLMIELRCQFFSDLNRQLTAASLPTLPAKAISVSVSVADSVTYTVAITSQLEYYDVSGDSLDSLIDEVVAVEAQRKV